MRYRKLPVVIEAVQWDGVNFDSVIKLVAPGLRTQEYVDIFPGNVLRIHTMEGTMTAQCGDWIIKGVKGELYPCKPDIFEQTYEAIE